MPAGRLLAALACVASACGRLGYEEIGEGWLADGGAGRQTGADATGASGGASAAASTTAAGVGGGAPGGSTGSFGGSAGVSTGGSVGAGGVSTVGAGGSGGSGGNAGGTLNVTGAGGAGGTAGAGGSGGASPCGSAPCVRTFVSAASVSNPIGSTTNADAKCQAFANAQSLGGTWKAWISDVNQSASARLTHSTVPYRLLSGTVVANDWNDLIDGSLMNPINVDEMGATRSGLQIWTGTDTSGASFSDGSCANWTNATDSNPIANVGTVDGVDQSWTMSAQQTCNQTTLHLYCLEQGMGPAGPGPAPSTCPSSVTFTSPVVDMINGGSGGSPHVRLCPAGQATIGYSMFEDRINGVVSGLVAVCGSVSVVNSGCQMVITPGAMFPLDGMTGTNGPFTRTCPANQVVVAIQGHSGVWLDQLSIGCAPLTLAKVGSSYQTTVGAITWLAAVGGTGGNAYSRTCPVGQVATGSDIHAGNFIDAFGLFCSTPVLLP